MLMQTTTRIILACDESGFKGYADQDESYPGEIGVYAGILMPEECVSQKMPAFQSLIAKYSPLNGKLHIADLPNERKQELRSDVYKAIKESGLPCFWYAIHTAGLHNMHLASLKLREDVEALKPSTPPRYKRGSPRMSPKSMHVELFLGLYGHLAAFLEERKKHSVHIEIRTDQVDSPIVKEFETVARRLLDLNPHVTEHKAFDTVTKDVVKGQISMQIHMPADFQINLQVQSLSINPIKEGDGLVLAADVLANSLNHLFKSRTDEELYKPLNTLEAVAKHPLFGNLDSFYHWGVGDLVGDRIYRHPKAPDQP